MTTLHLLAEKLNIPTMTAWHGQVTCEGKGPAARWRFRASKRSTHK